MKHSLKKRLIRLAAFAACAAITGCVVGPDFKRPAAPPVDAYTPCQAAAATQPSTQPWKTAGVANLPAGEPQQFVPIDIPGEWWALYHSKSLNALVERALKNNPDLKAAQDALTVAHEYVLAQQGAYYPSVTAGFGASRNGTAKSLAPIPNSNKWTYNLFTPDVNVSYTPDVFGLNHRTVESLQAEAEQTRFALAATHITLSSNVVAAAVQEALLREQITATNELITINNSMLKILKDQFAKGYADRLDVAAEEAQLAQVLATLPPLQKQLAQQRDLIAALAGGFPSKDTPEKFSFADIQLPRDLPLTLPSKLIEQRPDIRQAEENLHQASALIGVAVANRLPSFTLSADAGSMALSLGQIFANHSLFWTVAGSVSQPLFDGGSLDHKEKAARAAYLQAEEQYRSAVLTAFQNVADSLAALEHDASALKADADAEAAAKVSLDLTEQQLKAGYTTYLAVLSAEQTYQQAVITRVQAQSNRYADTAALFLSLGGGWWNRPDVPKN